MADCGLVVRVYFMIMDGKSFERMLVTALFEAAKARGYKAKPHAEAAWPDRKDAGTKWRKIRNGTEPRGLRVCDAYDLAQAMGVSFLEVCGLAQAMLLNLTPTPAPVITQNDEEEAPALEDTTKKDAA